LIPEAADIGCIRCGVCCKKYQPFLSLADTQEIADKLGVGWQQFKAEYADPRWPADDSILIRHRNGACPFLQTKDDIRQALCIIHSFKPLCCREWESRLEKADCREGLKAIWDLEIDSNGRVSGQDTQLDKFAAFLQSLR
jgi:Fe-S-cluster containining protein